MQLLTEILFEDEEQNPGFNVGPVYHGGTWNGKVPPKVTGRGALGSGAYFTPIKSVAETYARESGGKVTETFLKVRKPFELKMEKQGPLGHYPHPCILALEQLGMPKVKAEKLVDRVEEQKGYMGTEISKLATQQGYDALFQYFDGVLREIVIWNPGQVQLSRND